MQRQLVNDYSLLFKWQGEDASLKPILLTGHYDVVPVTSDIKTQWAHPPYDGVVADGHVWGRGTLDDKGSVITMFEAVERLVGEGFAPKRTIYFAIGHDEEIGGVNGAGAIVALLKKEGVQFLWSLDEGSMVLDDIIPGLPYPVASINLAEKGFLNIELVAKGKAGHSSMPPRQTAIGSISRAIDRLQNAPVPGGLDGVSSEFFDGLGRYFSFGKRIIFANQWLFGSLLEAELSKANTTNALLRTTTAPTIISGGVKDNILPAQAVANINFRLHPRDTVESIVAYVIKTIDDENVTVKAKKWANEASSVASHQADGYKHLAQTFKSVYGEVIVLPGLTIAGTDSTHYSKIADDSYRIMPMQVTNEDIAGFHGANEKLSLKNLKRAVTFYHQLIKVAAN
jgi:carboxypeptidase PM20D1